MSTSDVRNIHQALVRAINEGRISQSRLNQAVRRVLNLKEFYVWYNAAPNENFASIRCPVHLQLASEIASRALRTIKSQFGNSFLSQTFAKVPRLNDRKAPNINQYGVLYDRLTPGTFAKFYLEGISELALKAAPKNAWPLDPKNITVIAPTIVQADMCNSQYFCNNQPDAIFTDLKPTAKEIADCLNHAKNSEYVVIFTYNAWRFPEQQMLVNILLESGLPVQIVCLRDPIDAELFPQAQSIMATFSPTLPSIDAAWQRLTNENIQ